MGPCDDATLLGSIRQAIADSRFTGEFGTYHPDYRTWTQREYGNRTGIFRVLDVPDGLDHV